LLKRAKETNPKKNRKNPNWKTKRIRTEKPRESELKNQENPNWKTERIRTEKPKESEPEKPRESEPEKPKELIRPLEDITTYEIEIQCPEKMLTTPEPFIIHWKPKKIQYRKKPMKSVPFLDGKLNFDDSNRFGRLPKAGCFFYLFTSTIQATIWLLPDSPLKCIFPLEDRSAWMKRADEPRAERSRVA
jgi:hypothetical protein